LTLRRRSADFEGQQCTLAHPHSNAVVDLDGDCLAGAFVHRCVAMIADWSIDLFLVCDDGNGGKTYQIWVNEKSEGFRLSKKGPLPAGTQSISFADVGTWPMIYSTFVTYEPLNRQGRYNRPCFPDVQPCLFSWSRFRLLHQRRIQSAIEVVLTFNRFRGQKRSSRLSAPGRPLQYRPGLPL